MVLLFDLAPYTHTAPTLPPSNVKVTLIEEDTALVSWKNPDEPNVAVTHYTILYASRNAWLAGEWQVLQREGTDECGDGCGEKEVLHVCRGRGNHKDFLLSRTNNPLEISNSFYPPVFARTG